MINKCIIPVPGLGTRFLPITKTITKEMLTIIDLPVIYYQVKEAYLSGIKEIYFIVSKKNKELLKSFFTKDYELEEKIKNNPEKLALLKDINEIIDNMKFYYIDEQEKGTYGAIYSAREYLKDEYFAVIYGDDLIDSKIPVIKQLIDKHNISKKMVIGCKNYQYKDLPNYGTIKYNNEQIEDILYKDEVNDDNGDIIHGRFILHTKIFKIKDQLKRYNNELQLPGSLLYFKEELSTLRYTGEYFDIGHKEDFIKANIYYSLKDEKYKKEISEYIKKCLNI